MNRQLKSILKDIKASIRLRDKEIEALEKQAQRLRQSRNNEMKPLLKEFGRALLIKQIEDHKKRYNIAAEIGIGECIVTRLQQGKYHLGPKYLDLLEAWVEKQ